MDTKTLNCLVCFDSGKVRAVKHEKRTIEVVEEPCPMNCGAVNPAAVVASKERARNKSKSNRLIAE